MNSENIKLVALDPDRSDESVFLSDFNFVKIEDYRTLREKLKFLL